MALTPLRLERFADPPKADHLRRLQDNMDAATRPVFAAPIVDGKLLTDMELSAGPNEVNHALGRVLQGWILVGISSSTSGALAFSETINFIPIAANSTLSQTISVPGAVIGMPVVPAWPNTIEGGLVGIMYVSAADTVTVRLANVTAVAIDPASQAFGGRVLNELAQVVDTQADNPTPDRTLLLTASAACTVNLWVF